MFFAEARPSREQVAHELTHVVQQGRGAGSGASRPGDASEREASDQARAVAAGDVATVQQQGGAAVHGDWWDDVRTWTESRGHDIAQGVGLESEFDANLGRAEAFRGHGDFGPRDIAPTTGRGGFEAVYRPGTGTFQVVLRCAVNFVDGLTVDSGGGITPGNPALQPAATAAAGLAEPQRSAFIAQYQWAAGDKGAWMGDLETSVQTAWGRQYEFFVNRPQWEWIGATVDVDIQTAERARTPADHLALDTVKVPTGTAMGAASVSAGSSSDATDQSGIIGSTDIAPRVDNMLQVAGASAVVFASDSDSLDAAQMAILDTWIATYQGAPGSAALHPTQVTLQAHSSASGSDAHNLELSQRRAQAVAQYLAGHGCSDVATRVTVDNQGETGADPWGNTADQRVDLIVDGGQQQVVANYEFGHAFGLGQPDGTGANLPGAIHENNGNIMSLGTAVQPQHYSTFREALRPLTGIGEWALGPKQARPVAPCAPCAPCAPGVRGDFPTPFPGGPAIA